MPADLVGPALFLSVTSFVLLVGLLVVGRRSRLHARLEELPGADTAVRPDPVGQFAQAALPKMGRTLVPEDEAERSRLQARLVQAGLYSPQAMVWYLGIKMLLTVAPAVLGMALALVGIIPYVPGFVGGALLGIIGMIAPSIWLDRRKANRQTSIRRALPDALDAMVICLEGGLSLPDSVRRVSGELRTAHPLLASELAIVQRGVQLGRSTGEALRDFGNRADVEELRTLGSVLIQAERYGASLVRTFRIQAETLRHKRMQYAEEMAEKASVKILFPTLLCLFPSIFVVVLGPAVYHVLEILRSVRH